MLGCEAYKDYVGEKSEEKKVPLCGGQNDQSGLSFMPRDI